MAARRVAAAIVALAPAVVVAVRALVAAHLAIAAAAIVAVAMVPLRAVAPAAARASPVQPAVTAALAQLGELALERAVTVLLIAQQPAELRERDDGMVCSL